MPYHALTSGSDRIDGAARKTSVATSMSDDRDARPDARIGTTVGVYRLDSLIGVGGMGTVYQATAPDGTRVALKLVKANYARDETFRRRFKREARIAQTVRNPHVVPVLDTGEHDGLPYITERLVEGASLEQQLKREGRLDVPTAVRICAQVADGLAALWAAGMVHRDVKPGNILLDRAGQAYLTDFGLAKERQGTALTLPGQALGSMDYMAPEQIRGEEVTAATDIYALGCVMFECIDGQPPFADRQGMRVLWAHLQDEPPDPCAGRDDIPPGFSETLMLALRKDPAERPQSGIEYTRSLSQVAGIPALDGAG
jgi:serine/threonine protein kinase